MSTYSWKIESVNIDTGTVEVLYSAEGQDVALNLPMPDAGVDVAEWVDGYAPRSMWAQRPVTVEVGATGTGTIDASIGELAAGTELPNTVGNWQEEYIRAMIYSVLEEVRESAV